VSRSLRGNSNTMDNIANMLTIIRNAQRVKHTSVKVPYSKVNFGIAEVLKKEGKVGGIELKKRGEKARIIITLSYDESGEAVIEDIQRVSKSGKRVYAGYQNMPGGRQERGLAILSTPKGIMTDKEAKKQKVGGEILCKVI